MNVSSPFRLGYRKELDGLRTLAVFAVMLLHLGVFLPNGFHIASGGQAGVTLFFVISGFLITSLLLEEWRATATINLWTFYLRRIVRLFPALVALLVTTALLILLSRHAVNNFAPLPAAIPFAAFYLSNWILIWFPASLGTLAITWSLAVEEQFYIVWPLLLLFLLRRGISIHRLLGVVCGGIAAVTLLRVLLLTHSATPQRIMFGSDTCADSLLFGCALGIILQYRHIPASRALRAAAPLGLVLWLGVVLTAPVGIDQLTYSYLPVMTLSAVASTLLIGGLVLTDATPIHRGLAHPIMTWLGKRSYGIYLWHTTVFAFAPSFGLTEYPYQLFVILATLVPVTISYSFIERPALRLKSRLRPVADPLPQPVTVLATASQPS